MTRRRNLGVHPGLNRQVVDWLLEHSARPQDAALLWAFLLDGMDDDGRVTLELDALPARLRLEAPAAADLLSEMESIHALRRAGENAGPSLVCLLNPAIAPRPHEALGQRPLSPGERQLGDLRHYLPGHVEPDA